MGNTLPDDHLGVPPLKIHQYIYFSLYNHYFIGPFEKHDHRNL